MYMLVEVNVSWHFNNDRYKHPSYNPIIFIVALLSFMRNIKLIDLFLI